MTVPTGPDEPDRGEGPEGWAWLGLQLRAAPVSLWVVLAVAACLVGLSIPVGFGLKTDCTDSHNVHCQVIDSGISTNMALQGVIAASAVTIAVAPATRRYRRLLAPVGISLSIASGVLMVVTVTSYRW